MSSLVPDVGVRLSAEGEAQVLAVFKRMRAEAELTAKKSGQSFSGFNQVLGKMKGALASLGFGVSIAGFVAFARAGAEAADALEENAIAAGTTASRFSALAAMFQLNGGNAEFLRDSLGRLANAVQDLRDGSPEAQKKFAALGLTIRDFKGKDTAEALELVAQAVTAIPDPIQRGAAAIDVLGRSGARALPALRVLARDGLGGVQDAARQLGILLDDETVTAAARVADEMKIIEQAAGALATQLAAGLSPAFHDVFTLITDGAAESGQEMRTLGEVAGAALRYLVALLLNFGDALGTFAQQVVGGVLSIVLGTFATVVLTMRGQFDKIPALWDDLLGQLERRSDEFAQRTERRFNIAAGKSFGDVTTGGATTDPRAVPRTPGGAGDKAAFARRLAAQRAFLDAERQLLELNLKARGDQERFRFEEGLTDLETHFARRKQILEEGLAGELKALEGRRAIESLNPDRAAAKTAVASIDAEITRRKRQGEIDQAELAREELDARRKLQDEVLAFEDKLAAAQGRRHGDSIAAINAEAEAFRVALAQQGVGADEQTRRVNQFRFVLESQAEFESQLASFQSELDALAADRAAVEQQVADAQVSEIEGARTILALEQARIPELEKIAALALEAARGTGDPERIRQAQELATAIAGLGAAASEADRRIKNLGHEVAGLVESSLAEALGASGDAFESFGQRALSVLSSVLAGVQRLAAEILANQFIRFVLGLATSIPMATPAPNPGVPLPGGATGGFITGPGTGTSDSIPIRVSRGEYIVRAAAVAQPGGLAVLQAINHQLVRPAEILRQVRESGHRFSGGGLVGAPVVARVEPIQLRPVPIRARGFTEGGLVGTGGQPGQAGAAGTVTVELGPGLVANEIRSRAGQRAILEVITANREGIAAVLPDPEARLMSNEIGTATDFKDLLTKLDTFVMAKGQAFGLSYQGTGTGTLGSYTGGASSVAETFLITATSATNFTVVGSVSGSIGPATVGTPFSHAKIAFTLTAGGTAFIAGDVFTISTAPPYTRKRGVSAGNVTRWRINATKNELSGTAGIRFARVEMMITAGGADQINGSGGTATQSSTVGSNTADKAADTDLATIAEMGAETAWWEYAFTGNKQIVEVAITAAQTSPTGAPQDFTLEYWSGTAWVIAASFRNETAWAVSERRVFALVEYIWQAPGNDGLAQILFGAALHRNASTGWYNWRLNGYTAYDAAVDWFTQPGSISLIDSYGPMLPLSNGSLAYWFVGNGRRVMGVVKSGSVYGAFYLGFPLTYASPGQYPYPLFVGGSLYFEDEPVHTDTRYLVGNAHDRHTSFVLPFVPLISPDTLIPISSSARLRKPDGQWFAFHARSSFYDIKAHVDTRGAVWPYAWGFTNLKPDLDGKYSLVPVMYLEANPHNVYCQLDGILAVSGASLSPEASLSVPRTSPASGNDTYIAFPDVTRSTAGDFFALKLD